VVWVSRILYLATSA